ncbi:MAG: hypothetical protein ACOY5B_13160 [Spirochaetota bacterium]
MEIGLAILLFVCMTALLYVLLSLKITRQVDLQMKEFYKTRIHSDIQEFYREMEGYAALMENRIQRFKSLVERSEALPERGATAQVAEQPEIPPVQQSQPVGRRLNKKTVLQKAALPVTPEKKRAIERGEKKTPKVTPAKSARGKEAKRPGTEPARAAVAPAEQSRPAKQQLVPVVPAAMHDYSRQFSAAVSEQGIDADTTIAEELMKDLFAQDEMQLSRRVNMPPANDSRPAPVPERVKAAVQAEAESSGVTSIFARIGKALEPVVFGERPQVTGSTTKVTAPPVQTPSNLKETAPSASAKTTDFAEVLRRAEQIKAEKKAERERAEIEARAEFYTAGDAFVPSGRTGSAGSAQGSVSLAGRSDSAATRPSLPRESDKERHAMPARNSLAVKSLDEHTISFLIDSLKHDAGYRKQALRALTENNIPLEEIARLSRIDIGELQLMSQLGKF